MEENIMNNERSTEEVYPVRTLQKKWYQAILYALGMILLAFAIQFAIGGAAGAVYLVKYLAETGIDIKNSAEQLPKMLQDSGFLNVISAAGSFALAIVFGLWYKFKYAKHYTVKELKQTASYVTARNTGLFLLAVVTCYVLAINIILILDYLLPNVVDGYRDMAKLVFEDGPVTLIMSLISAPIAEECLVRGIIQRRLEKYFPMLAVVIMVAVCFGILHGNLVQGLYVLPFGMVCGYLSYRTRSVLPPILFHALYNYMPNLVSLIPDQISDQNWIWHVAAVVLTAGLIALWKLKGRKEQEDDSEN